MSTAAEGELDPLGVGDHCEQRVDALHLRVPQMVAGPASDRVVPRDVELAEEVDRAVTDLGQEVVRGELDREAERVGTTVLLVHAGLARVVWQCPGALLPGHRELGVLRGVGVGLPGRVPGQRRSLVLRFAHRISLDRATDRMVDAVIDGEATPIVEPCWQTDDCAAQDSCHWRLRWSYRPR